MPKLQLSLTSCWSHNYLLIKMHTCRKEIVRWNDTRSICRWKGALEDYVTHMIRCHKNSYFRISDDRSEFEWNILDGSEDQVDKCLLCSRSRHLLYRVRYRSEDGRLRHVFKPLEDEKTDPLTDYSIGVYDAVGGKFYECRFVGRGAVYATDYLVEGRRVKWAVFVTPRYVD